MLQIDALACPRCSTPAQTVPMVVLAFLSDPEVVGKILSHLRIPTTAPALAPARSSVRALAFALPEDHAAPTREEGGDAGDPGASEPLIRPPP